MWLPMWVFDGNGFTMAYLAVWIRNFALRWGSSRWRANVAKISVATSGTDFTAPEAVFDALNRAAGFCRSRSSNRRRSSTAWREGYRHDHLQRPAQHRLGKSRLFARAQSI